MHRKWTVLTPMVVMGFAVAMATFGGAGEATARDAAKKASAGKSSCCATEAAKAAQTESDACKKIAGAAALSVGPRTARAGIWNGLVWASALTDHGDDCCCCGERLSTAGASSCVKETSYATAAVARGATCVESASAGGHVKSAAAGESCHGKSAKAAAYGDRASCTAAKHASNASLEGVVDDLPYRENKRLVLTGTVACANCTMGATEDCAPLLKTADGKVYPLLKNGSVADLNHASAANGIQVSARVRKIDGIKYLDVKSYRVL